MAAEMADELAEVGEPKFMGLSGLLMKFCMASVYSVIFLRLYRFFFNKLNIALERNKPKRLENFKERRRPVPCKKIIKSHVNLFKNLILAKFKKFNGVGYKVIQ